MPVKVARHAGFCFGVKNAIKMAELEAEKGDTIYTLGMLIHNQQVVDQLTEKGIKPINDLNEIENGTIVIRSHGVSPDVIFEAKAKRLKIVDATCPFVAKAQQLAKELTEEGYRVVVIGDPKHPEVVGIVGWTGNKAIVIEEPSAVLQLPREQKIGVLAQTTQPLANFQEIVKNLVAVAKELRVYNTICHATAERQEAVRELASEVDLMLVVGGLNSANTRKLAKICEDTGTPTYHVETASDLEGEWFKSAKAVGLTAGASTPDWIIEEVKVKMEELMKEPADSMDYMTKALDDMTNPRKGDVVSGVVVQVDSDGVLIDVGAKSEALIPLRELACYSVDDPTQIVQPGDEVKVVVMRVDDNEGRIICSKQRVEASERLGKLEEAYQAGDIVEGTVVEAIKGGLLVDLGVRSFLPASQLDVKYVDNLEQYVGKSIRAKIIEFDKVKPRVVLSRKVILAAEAKKAKEAVLASIEEGQVLDGTVKRITDFGAFVDLGGVDGLLHVSEMAWHRVKHPSEVVKEGETLKVKVLKVEKDKEKIALGLKQVLPNPWENIESKYAEGNIVTGKVVRLTNFGAFVELEPGVDGLIHLSQLADRHVHKAEEVVKPGQEIKVKVIETKSQEKRISLSLKEVEQTNE